jgi:hypothetical protein
MASKITDEDLREWASELYKDEVLDEECQSVLDGESNLYKSPFFKEVFAACKKEGRDGSSFDFYYEVLPDGELEYTTNAPSDPRFQITVFQHACLTPDFVWVDAMIRLGADYERLTGDGNTPLSLTCKMMQDRNRHWITHPGRIRIIRRLLQLGVDPNIQCVLQYACVANDLPVCEILLMHGADPRIRAEDGRLPKEHLAAPLRRRFLKLQNSKPLEPVCWCLTSGRLLKKCHGKDGGREADARYGCPCKSGKSYGKCCKKNESIKFKETRNQFIQQRTAVFSENDPIQPLLKCLKELNPNVPAWDPESSLQFQKIIARALRSTTDASQFDPAFAYALENTDFEPKYWKNFLPKNGRLLRQKVWNDAVDEYTASIRDKNDTRTAREIEECAKIGVDGARLYKECAYCQTKEQREAEFSVCTLCKMRAYCGKECQKAHWKEGHKASCGAELTMGKMGKSCPLHLPSQERLDAVKNAVTDQMMQRLSVRENA